MFEDLDPESSMPRSSVVFLFFVFGAITFLIQMVLICLGSVTNYAAFETFYNPVIVWLLGGFPQDGENTTISLAFLIVTYSTIGGFVGLTIMRLVRFLKR
jgi:hypothetical protein